MTSERGRGRRRSPQIGAFESLEGRQLLSAGLHDAPRDSPSNLPPAFLIVTGSRFGGIPRQTMQDGTPGPGPDFGGPGMARFVRPSPMAIDAISEWHEERIGRSLDDLGTVTPVVGPVATLAADSSALSSPAGLPGITFASKSLPLDVRVALKYDTTLQDPSGDTSASFPLASPVLARLASIPPRGEYRDIGDRLDAAPPPRMPWFRPGPLTILDSATAATANPAGLPARSLPPLPAVVPTVDTATPAMSLLSGPMFESATFSVLASPRDGLDLAGAPAPAAQAVIKGTAPSVTETVPSRESLAADEPGIEEPMAEGLGLVLDFLPFDRDNLEIALDRLINGMKDLGTKGGRWQPSMIESVQMATGMLTSLALAVLYLHGSRRFRRRRAWLGPDRTGPTSWTPPTSRPSFGPIRLN